MASHYDDDQTKMRIGYPPVTGYRPPSAVAYPGYPPNAHNGYPYTAPPPSAYYNNQQPAAPPYNSGDAYSLLPRIVISMITTLTMIGMLFFLIWLMIRPRYPIVNIESLMVSNFTIVDSEFNADWDLTYYIWNPNKKLDMRCNTIQILIFYGKNLLSTTSMQPLLLEKENATILHKKLETRQDKVSDGYMENDRKTGSMIVSVRLRILAKFQNGDSGTREHKLAVSCDYLRINFLGDTNNGKLAPGPAACTLYEV
ncbi:uncharacterized protein LOC122078120 [Macadamia integrifolia]|uniref:uncharacterized protein LOC122078120 n=1 Tax=Macadamia integrifolia TaxID=60698 RepID=UPI001C4F0F18|nr:uncharacterized protein LOC122078120 [Macadamia integrifolia]